MNEIDRLVDLWSDEKVLEMYRYIHMNVVDDWYPIMFVTYECEKCSGDAHPFENHKSKFIKVECKNCHYSYLDPKDDEYYRNAVKFALEMNMKAVVEFSEAVLRKNDNG